MKLLNEIQQKLKVKKSRTNKQLGGAKYRNCDDILEAIKPLLGEATLTIQDEPVLIGTRFYIQSTATLKLGDESASATSYAREEESKKGLSDSQLTGLAISYARKTALGGLFCIDDGNDADGQNNGKPEPPEADLTDAQNDFAEKLKIKLEESLEGETISVDEVKKYMRYVSKSTGNPMHEKDEQVTPLAAFILKQPAILNKLKGAS